MAPNSNHNRRHLGHTVVLHRVKVLVVIDNPHLTADSFKSITGSGPVAHNGFVAETFAVRSQPKMRLFGSSRNMVRCGNCTGARTIGLLNFLSLLYRRRQTKPSGYRHRSYRSGQYRQCSGSVCTSSSFRDCQQTAGSDNHGFSVDVERYCRLLSLSNNGPG